MKLTHQKLLGYVTFVVCFTLVVILLGVLVRATGSGAGCGDHWPLCNGSVIPQAKHGKTWIEFTHRVTSGLCLIFIFLATWFSLKFSKTRKGLRRAAIASTVFIITEAAIGAVLVLQRLVENNSSIARAVVIAAHLINTFFLLASLAWLWLEVKYAGENNRYFKKSRIGSMPWAIGAGLLLTGATGAIVALGDTLFPANSLLEGMRSEFDRSSHFLVRLRWVHPLLAVTSVLIIFVQGLRQQASETVAARHWRILSGMGIAQFALGVMNWVLLAPIWLQIVHLFFADLIWLVFVVATWHQATEANEM